METEIARASASESEFVSLLERSRAGDAEALQSLVELLDPDIERLSRKMMMEKSDAKQTLKTELIAMVFRKE
ncbi:helix-turn-helix domain-containing protein [Saccharibacillus kuerlensis]|uniref:Helix-turn-helix conjugative transposon-like domain-containing protein n=1 Tax=Saccharibacillus kuerlensis TaxID=459527 RepID=A0ABQ2KZV9_9BACL|nr:helix-turn-helix domain-containing protein [Saccharibacillus kuerlensis]GGN97864.1 hypothetical protein GCM10010969_16210 [Saccharibacillus kuerlensis]